MSSQHKYLTDRGYLIARNMLTSAEESKIKKDLTISPQSIYSTEKEYPIFLYSDKYYYVPKYYGIENYGPPIKNKLNYGSFSPISAEIKQEPLPFQYTADKKLQELFNKDASNDANCGILSLPCGYGKCHGINTEILMFPLSDGNVKYVQDIIPGDLLLGDDLTPRTVLGTVIGYGSLFLIKPRLDFLKPYVVNADHILSMRDKKDRIININVIDYLNIKAFWKCPPLFGYTNITKLRFPIDIIQINNGWYYGFSLTGNRLYTLSDYQVTHNTYLALRTACRLKLKTMIIVSKEFLRDQWIESITRFTTASYGILQQKKIELDKDFCIAMIHTLCLKEFDRDIFSEIGFLVIDECHHLASEMFVKALFKIRPPYILGLSATPDRPDGLSHVFHKFIGGVFHKEKRTGINNVIIKKIIMSGDPDKNDCYITKFNKMGLKNTVEMTTDLGSCVPRNNIIIEIIKVLLLKNRTILVLSSRRNHLHELHQLMTEAELKKSNLELASYGFYYGKLDTNSRQHKEMLAKTSKCDVILGTEHVAKEGLDIPALNTLIFATPPGIYIEQSVGRILRKYHEHFPPLVVDICDKVGNYIAHGRERDIWYTSENYHIDKIKFNVNETDISKLSAFIINADSLNKPESHVVLKKNFKKAAFKDCMI